MILLFLGCLFFNITCAHICLVALHAGTELIKAKHAYVVVPPTLQISQITVGRSVVAFSLLASILCDTYDSIRLCSTGSLPGDCSRV